MSLCSFVCLCVYNHVIWWMMKHEWQRWPVSQGRPSHSSVLWNHTQTNTLHMHTLQRTGIQKHLEDKNAYPFPLLYSSQSYHCTFSFGFTLGFLFIQDQICLCHSFESLFCISQWHCLITEPWTNALSACLRLFYVCLRLSFLLLPLSMNS